MLLTYTNPSTNLTAQWWVRSPGREADSAGGGGRGGGGYNKCMQAAKQQQLTGGGVGRSLSRNSFFIITTTACCQAFLVRNFGCKLHQLLLLLFPLRNFILVATLLHQLLVLVFLSCSSLSQIFFSHFCIRWALLLLLLLLLSHPLSHNKRPRKGGTENKGANTRSGECSQ